MSTTTWTRTKIKSAYGHFREEKDVRPDEQAAMADKAFMDNLAALQSDPGAPASIPEDFGPTAKVGRNGGNWRYYPSVGIWKEIG